ncbi:ABC transporter ATP-binding protein [Eubacterium sp. 1001713B170207_170306_E7]|uniref:ABC transporter ATP-binding protein n=1 Tax=Eubacterium sp. 1001713B170207_170306_E7 TaxID=2787097 RepID=UPI00189BCC35|nr:ABC transporter ATP-binding protein [Eubacterium sp. 1001713B170207_170306_E7]
MFKTIRHIIKWTGGRKKRLYWGFLWSFLQSIFTAMPVIGAAYALELMLEDQRGEIALTPIWALWFLIFMIGMIFGRFLFSYLKATFQESIAYEKTAEERIRIGDILKRVSLGFFDRNNTGELAGAVTTDLSVLEMYAMKMTDVVVGGYISALAIILCLAFYSWQIALIAVAGILGSAFFLRMLSRRSRVNAAVHQEAQNDLIAATLEYIRGLAVVKAYGQEGVSTEGMKRACGEHRRINVKIELDYIPCNCLHQFCLKLASVAVAAAAAVFTAEGAMTVPVFLMFAVFSFMIFTHVEQINNAAHTMELIESTFEKLDKIEKAKFIDENGRDIKPDNFNIAFKNVSFGYDSRPVLENVSFAIPEKTTTAIVGPSGSGKTTVCSLLARFYDVDSGAVTIGSTDIRELTCDSLLSNIGMVFQNVYLFHDTILNNIRFGNPGADMEAVIKAAKEARCHEFITAMPDGYNTLVGEGGSSLSGGEKQRISIARAILKDAPIVILDEATASVDPENEHFIQEAISSLTNGKTIIVIAHRLATIERADQILVVDNGRIAQRGTHAQLIQEKGIYRQFVDIREAAEGWRIA